MSTVAWQPRPRASIEDRMAVAGLALGLLALALLQTMDRPPFLFAAAFGPEDLKAWAAAIAAAMGSLATATSAGIIAMRQVLKGWRALRLYLGNRPKKRRRKDRNDDPTVP